jgi:Ca2+-binding RTX toxin-like protein
MKLAQFAATAPVVGASEPALAGITDMYLYDGGASPVLFTVTRAGGWLSAYDVSSGAAALSDSWYLDDVFLQLESTDLAVTYGPDGAQVLLAGLLSDDLVGVSVPSADSGVVFGGQSLWQTSGVSGATFTDIEWVEGTQFGLVSLRSGGLVSLDVSVTGQAAATSVPGGGTLSDARVSAMASATINGVHYGVAGYAQDDALGLFRLNDAASIEPIANIFAGADDGWFANPAALAFAEVGGESFVIMAASGSQSLTVLRFSDTNGFEVADHILDSLETRFAHASYLQVVEFGDMSFVIAAGTDSGFSVFALLPGGRLHPVETVAGSLASPLNGITGIQAHVSGDDLRLWVSTQSAPYLSEYLLTFEGRGSMQIADPSGGALSGTGAADILAGQGGADVITGGAGDDIILDGAGADTLTGGAGADEFVFVRDDQRDIITDFEPGLDRIDLTGLNQQWDLVDLIVLSRHWGAELRYGDEVIEVRSLTQTPLAASDFGPGAFVTTDRVTYTGIPVEQIKIVYAQGAPLTGSNAADWLHGDDTNDLLSGAGGDDTLWGVAGDDTLYGGTGNDRIEGGEGQDNLFGDAGFDVLLGGPGNDVLEGGAQADELRGGDGDDRLLGGDGFDTLYGEDGDDVLLGGDTVDRLYGGAGNDVLRGGINVGDSIEGLFGEDGDDLLFGDGGYDLLDGGAGNDVLDGGNQADNLYGGTGNDILIGGNGFDRLFGGDGQDDLRGDAGTDALFGQGGDDVLNSGADDDRLWGGAGDDTLFGGDGNDSLRGDAGFDRLDGGAGNDDIWGNFNADVFVFTDGHGHDRIMDFDALNTHEKLDLSALGAFNTLSDVQEAAMQIGDDLMLPTGPDSSILLIDVVLGDLDASDFLF